MMRLRQHVVEGEAVRRGHVHPAFGLTGIVIDNKTDATAFVEPVSNEDDAMQIFDLTGRRALVTGASQGIGLALAKGLAEAGATLVLNGRDEARLAAAAAQIPGASTLAFDVTDHALVRAAVDRFEAERGAIDILVNNAGMQYRAPLEDF